MFLWINSLLISNEKTIVFLLVDEDYENEWSAK